MAKKTLKKGLLITFDGPDGCGKSTHAKLAVKLLKKEGYDVLYTREPGGTKVGNRIREVLLNLKGLKMSPLTEMLLFEASRAELVKEVISPALFMKKVVICDRFNSATLVYQGYAGQVPLKNIYDVECVSVEGMKPDLTIFLDIDADRGLRRIGKAGRDRMESKKISFHRKVRSGYLALAARDKKRIRVIKSLDKIEDTFSQVKKEVMNAVRKYKK